MIPIYRECSLTAGKHFSLEGVCVVLGDEHVNRELNFFLLLYLSDFFPLFCLSVRPSLRPSVRPSVPYVFLTPLSFPSPTFSPSTHTNTFLLDFLPQLRCLYYNSGIVEQWNRGTVESPSRIICQDVFSKRCYGGCPGAPIPSLSPKRFNALSGDNVEESCFSDPPPVIYSDGRMQICQSPG